ncbi:MAG: hypothetical protein PHG19_13080 [Anaerotignum sp.]|nr:hypothetical protein [Anaerotignum sp.]
MLGILLAVLKFIGFLLLGILLLLLFIIAVVLISPLKYRLAGEKKDAFKGDFAVHWLFGLIRISGSYVYGSEPQITVKILWFTLSGKKKKKRVRRKKPKPSHQPIKTGAVVAREKVTPKKQPTEGIYMAEPVPFKGEQATPSIPQAPLLQEEPPPASQAVKEEPSPQKPRVRRVKVSEIQEKPIDIAWEAEDEAFFLGEAEEDDECTSTTDKLRSYWNKFQEIEGKHEIFHAVKKLLKRLIKGILPNQLMLKATLGLGEPHYTGYLMGLIGILTAKFGKNIQVKADFTRLVAEDIEINIKGKLVMGYFMYSLLAFAWTKPVRRILIKLWKGRKQNG